MAVPVNRLTDPKNKYGLDKDSLKAAFEAKTIEKRPKVKKLVENIRDVIRDGINRNQRDYRLFKAMDWAYDSPFYQVSYTQLRHLLSSGKDDKKVMETVNQWGLTHLLPTMVDENGKTCCHPNTTIPMKALNLPVFFNIFVPICMAYITIRWAKLFNDRNLVPHFKYEPVQFTKENRVRCEVLTQAVQRQSTWFGYPADTRQGILQTLIYGLCIHFPRESWFVEKQEDESGKEKIIREGIRFNLPHPSRMYYDLYHRLSSLNSNSGCRYAGHWELCRYGDITDNNLYWNTDSISKGAVGWFDAKTNFLEEVFPCTLSFPDFNSTDGIGGAGALDRMSEAYRAYGTGDYNNATLLTNHFQCLTPADYGLGKYEHPIWMRFVMASDNPVIFAEPLPYSTIPMYAYDADFNRSRFRSLALEIIPFQDHVSNLLTQWIAAVKENLLNPIFVDKDKLPAEALSMLQNMGFKDFGGRRFFPFSATENFRFKTDQREAFYMPTMARHDTSQIASTISGVLDMLDRIMQLSPQEVGQAASHEQTAEESRIIANNTSTRVTFTGTFIDDGDYAKKQMLYEGLMAYADDEIIAGISVPFATTEEELKKLLEKLGMSIDDKESFDTEDGRNMVMVKARKNSLTLDQFASTRDGDQRINNAGIADAMSKIFTAIAGNEYLIQSIGPQQLVELLNQIIVTAGLPKEFRLRGKDINMQASAEEQNKQVQDQITGFAQQVKQALDERQKQTLEAAAQQSQQMVLQATDQIAQQLSPMAEAIAKNSQDNQVQAKQLEEVAAAVAQLNQVITAAMPPQPPMPQPPNPLNPPAPPVMPVEPAVPVGVPA